MQVRSHLKHDIKQIVFPKQVDQVKIEASGWRGLCSCVLPRWEIPELMNVELDPSASSDYLDLNLFPNKHSASRLCRHKPASRPHRLLIALFSPADETSLTAREAMSTRRTGEEGVEGGGRSHFWWYYILIISVNTPGRGSWANLSVDFPFHVRLWGVYVQPAAWLSSLTSHRRPCGNNTPPPTHPSSFILLMDIPPQTSASLPDCNPLKFNSLYI